ncbi:tryptophan-rich sensory protein [Arthrobacter sp. Br18]|uniref:tryptophan-rich sensory protein n=1 Tax=Arthrobacter sp. Br18 TaxID=1312954 RepID=UPI0004B51248|nr:tryptophan-rich sensory protein [Arthrobacter sp. Br18]
MNTPQNQGLRLPHAPSSPPSDAAAATAAQAAADVRSTEAEKPVAGGAHSGKPGVLERLKAARPGMAALDTSSVAPPAGLDDGGKAGNGEPEHRAATDSADSAVRLQEPSTPAATRAATDSADSAVRPQEPATPAATRAAARAAAAGAATARTAARGAATASRAVRDAGNTSGKFVRRGASATTANVRSWDPDRVRQVAVSLAAIACIGGSAAGVGAFGGASISDAAGGILAPDATLLAPASRAFTIWSVIYAGLILFTLYQWLPSQRAGKRQRRLGWVVASSMLLNVAWILSVQASMLSLSLGVILLLLGVLLYALRILNRTRPRSRWEGLLVDVPLGLYLGWVIVAAAANIASVATAGRADLFGWGGLVWALVGLAAVTLGTMMVCMTDRGRLSVAFAACWGLTWIAVERFFGEPTAPVVAFAAAFAVFLVLVSAGSRRHQVDHNYRRWTRAQQDATREPLDLLATREPDDADR